MTSMTGPPYSTTKAWGAAHAMHDAHLQAAPWLQRRGVVHHLHDQRSPCAHLRGGDVEAELQGHQERSRSGCACRTWVLQGKWDAVHQAQAHGQNSSAQLTHDCLTLPSLHPTSCTMPACHLPLLYAQPRLCLHFALTPRKASSKLDLPSDCPPMATISGIGKFSPKATAAACRREYAS